MTRLRLPAATVAIGVLVVCSASARTMIPGTEGAYDAAVSGDGLSSAFDADPGGIWRLPFGVDVVDMFHPERDDLESSRRSVRRASLRGPRHLRCPRVARGLEPQSTGSRRVP